MKHGCSCIACRFEEAFLGLVAAPTAEQFQANAEKILPAAIPIMGVLLATIKPHELEPTWRLMLDARSRALVYGEDRLGPVAGRA